MDEIRGEPAQLSVSIVTHNSSLELLQRTLSSLQVAARRAVPKAISRVGVTVVDNASDADYQAQLGRLLEEFPAEVGFQVQVLNLPRNLGYGGGHNRALTESDYHLVLNPDVEVAEDALVAGIARFDEQPGTVLLSPRATGSDGEQEFLCKRHPSVLVLALRAFAPGLGQRWFPRKMADYQMSDVCSDDNPVEVPLASGCFMLLRGSSMRSVGGFDERYFMYFEDFDLSLRLAAEGRVEYLPAMRIIHHGGYAGSKGLAHMQLFASAGLRFFRQHGWRWF
jgi:GT2 family glycosyltransferase